MKYREKLSWTDTWWDNATEEENLPRVLLVGDSIVRGYFPMVKAILGKKVNVDKFATSKFVADPFFEHEICCYLKEYSYDCIHFNNGLHALDVSIEEYETAYTKIVEEILKLQKNLVLVLSSPLTDGENMDALLPEKNPIVIERNKVVQKIAEKYGLPVDDLYTPMLNHPEYRLTDCYHYNEVGHTEQAKIVTSFLKPYIEK